jgi:hypothetical protein
MCRWIILDYLMFFWQCIIVWTCFCLPTWCTISLFCNICITLNTSTCFEHYYAHPQEVKIVFLQHLVPSLSMSGHAVNPIPRIPTKMNCHPSHNYKQHGSTSNNCSSDILNHPILLPKNFLLKIYDPKYWAKMKFKIPQK